MLYLLSDDDLGLICTQLDMLSGLGLASTAKTIRSQARRLKLRGRADAASETIQRAFRRYHWASSLRQLLAKKEPIGEDAVAYQANKAKDVILARFTRTFRCGLYSDRKTRKAAFKQMKTAFTILHEVSELTTQPDKQQTAQKYAEVMIDVLLELADSLRDRVHWDEDDINGPSDFFIHTFPLGDTETSLKCYFTQAKVFTGWCLRGNEMMNTIIGRGPQKLEQSALTFAAIHCWECVDSDWHWYAESMYEHTGSIQVEGIEFDMKNDGLLRDDEDEMLQRLSDPLVVDWCPNANAMFRAMRAERNTALVLGSTEREANELAMMAAHAFIKTMA